MRGNVAYNIDSFLDPVMTHEGSFIAQGNPFFEVNALVILLAIAN